LSNELNFTQTDISPDDNQPILKHTSAQMTINQSSHLTYREVLVTSSEPDEYNIKKVY